jgi:ribosomal protein S18 acetylase RimI-like enzyme
VSRWRPELRLLSKDDLPEALALWTRAGIQITLSDRITELERVLEHNPETCLAAVDGDGKIVGAVLGTFDGRRAHIWHLAVTPELQGNGIGRALLAELERLWMEMGVVKVSFSSEVDNRSAIAFYEHLGYAYRHDICYLSKTLREE